MKNTNTVLNAKWKVALVTLEDKGPVEHYFWPILCESFEQAMMAAYGDLRCRRRYMGPVVGVLIAPMGQRVFGASEMMTDIFGLLDKNAEHCIPIRFNGKGGKNAK